MTLILLTAGGIVLPALVLAWAVRRWLDPVPWRVVALIIGLSLLFTGRGVFTPDMPVPLDEVVRGYPYRGLFGEIQAKNSLTNDTTKQILPWMHVVREQFAQGRAPLWNPYLFGGYPLLGNGQSAPFSPVFLATLFVPLPKQLVAMAGLKLFIALLFGYLLIKRETSSDSAALFGSGVFAFAIFNSCFLYYPMTAVTLLLPAAAYAVLACATRPTRAPFVLLVLVVAALMAGGHPESVVHVAMAVVALLIVEYMAPGGGQAPSPVLRSLSRVTTAAIFGALISAPAWVPVVEQALVSLRVLSLRTVEASPHFPATALWAMTNPDGFGNPAHGNWNWIFSYTHVASLYLGLIVTALIPAALLSPRATRRDRLLVVVTLLFFLASMDWIVGGVLNAVPPISWVAHDRLRFVVCFFVGLIAARTVTRLKNFDLFWTVVTAVAVLAPSIYVFVKLIGKTLTPASSIGIVCLVFFCAVALWKREWAPASALVLTTIELFIFTLDYNAITSGRYYAPRLPIVDALKRAASVAPPEPFRILGLDWVLLPNAAAEYGLEDVRGSDPMEWADYVRFFRVAEVKDDSIDVKRIVNPYHPAIDFLNVRFLLTEPGANLSGKWEQIYKGIDGELYENREFKGRFFVPEMLRRASSDWAGELAGSADFAETPLVSGRDLEAVIINPRDAIVTTHAAGSTEFRLRVATPAPAVVASSHPFMRGWSVRVNDATTKVMRVNGAFLGFAVPAGSSDVVIRYSPLSYWGAVGVFVLSLLGLATTLRLWNRRGREGVVWGPRNEDQIIVER